MKHFILPLFCFLTLCVQAQTRSGGLPDAAVLVEKTIVLKDADTQKPLPGIYFTVWSSNNRFDGGSFGSQIPVTDSTGSAGVFFMRMMYFRKGEIKIEGSDADKYAPVDKRINLGKEKSKDEIVVLLKQLK